MSGLVTNDGKNLIIYRLMGTSKSAIAQLKVGIDDTTPVDTNSDINLPIPIQNFEVVDDCDATTGWVASGTNSVSLNTTRYVENQLALNLIKSDVSAATCSMAKTTTSLADFADKKLWMFVYISSALHALLKATGAALSIRFGTDSSNYYQKDYTKAELTAAAWNQLGWADGDADSTTGSPGTTTLDYTFIQYETAVAGSTSSAGEFVVDDIKVASADDSLKDISAGYPTINTGTRAMTTRAVLSSVEANGAIINEVGLFNNDSTPVLFAHDTYTDITKNEEVEIIFEWVDEIA